MTKKLQRVTTFKPRHQYYFAKDFSYEDYSRHKTIELKKGDMAIFDGKSMYARFYVKDRDDPEDRWWLILLKRPQAFRLMREIAQNACIEK